ncbi:hypothetical protein ABW02_23295 [Niallia circulans]|uniref:N-acetyltransferase domain-containing protein n=1 Tax=Niallia circulans TaxID=1397 RepID=A0A0J1I3Y1_NIACI|nr:MULTISPECIES: GNAT family N-acetyltransferase [Bacillaceae]KAB7665687.1 GNAT family N-acetyltransferase [Bacillus sp. B1-b2]KLV20657.1 hypothetical protein ABW02_23295 [Niallia circulans]
MELIRNFEHNKKLRGSFNELATNTFGISFEDWYEKGFWTEKYSPFSIVQNEKIIANVSANKVELIINNEKKRGIQIGTVMTHPDFRKLGLSRKLMEIVLEHYENQYDFMYLFANSTVLDFYPKFGFKRVPEHQFTMNIPSRIIPVRRVTKLNGTDSEVLNRIFQYSRGRLPVSFIFGSENSQELLMFYCLNVFSQDIYYIDDLDLFTIHMHDGETLHLFDVISQKEVTISDVINRIANEDTKNVVFHYTPDYGDIVISKKLIDTENDVLFIKIKNNLDLPEYFKHPITVQA